MVNAISQNLGRAISVEKAVDMGAMSRLRPVLMTAAITALSLIPLLLSTGTDSEVQ
jgi:cobalt-zinc-cadmium resistance protein CzcA